MNYVTLFLLLVAPQIASACSCLRQDGTLEERFGYYYQNSDNVFLALITSSKIEGTPKEFSAINSHFHVLETYRGNPKQWTNLTTEGSTGTSCTSRLITGEKYLFFIDRNRVGHCSWVFSVYSADEEKQYKDILASLTE
ncbi:hypothetical protein R50072_06550 [Simiduia litorea]|uniref:hypothetical protein n=1 Tax=Simiduia litorea TaxID=1435348 RepID=UPI0036F2FC0C